MNANLEEAATIAAEYISKLQQEIQKEGGKYVRHSLKNPGQPLAPKDGAIPQNISAQYAEIDQLAAEKIALAERMVQLIQRARARLDHDLSKASYSLGQGSRNPAERITESLRNAIAIPEAPPPAPSASVAPPQKKRRIATAASAGSIKLPSPAPMPASAYGAGQRSRASQQTRQSPARSRRVTASAGLDADEDAEGEDDLEMEEGGDAEDKEIYCICQRMSYGEMIACDNPNCRYQWFHLDCVHLKSPLPESWYCSDCLATMKKGGMGAANAGRKGRKK
ncbi:uncharacterized protein B0H18DRAFT_1112295 [Fomitopsis serialis]|uniref:uncharacterized protein n=1 Tax=Fomitopsis serialis TaxID=139415 RepID=UPI0020075543|nr:uncharacterized protein B0H18DRAFT_1112295 [Neoantrodia serialis]KAH9938109.1 hypothetical protein B0H18DRAFT_1112295 [Neoantrodia serialis]